MKYIFFKNKIDYKNNSKYYAYIGIILFLIITFIMKTLYDFLIKQNKYASIADVVLIIIFTIIIYLLNKKIKNREKIEVMIEEISIFKNYIKKPCISNKKTVKREIYTSYINTYKFADNFSDKFEERFKERQKEKKENNIYTKKEKFVTDCEKIFFNKLKKIYASNYIIQPQVNLATIIDKTNGDKYRSELFRNIDFGIFTKDYKLLVLIELNDSSHNQYEKRKRDYKVKAICEKANIPLVTFWTNKPNEEWHIKKRIDEYLY